MLCRKIAVLTVALVTVSLAANAKAAKFNVIDRTLIAEYRALDRDRIPLVIASKPARTGEVVRAIKLLGGNIVSRQDDIGFLYVQIPLKNISQVEKIRAIEALEIPAGGNRSEANVQGQAEDRKIKKTAPAPSSLLPLDNPYTAEYVTQASDFKKTDPMFDGRGVVVGFVEFADPSLPSMRGALDLHGIAVPKFNLFSFGLASRARGANEGIGGRFWQHTQQVFPDQNGRFNFAGRSYKIPAELLEKEWRVCARGSSSKPQTSSSSGGGEIVLWAVSTGRLWVLSEGKTDVAQAPSLQVDPNSQFLVLRDDDQSRTREPYRSWVFEIDYEQRLVAFGRPNGHAEMVASIVAGNGFLGSQSGGIAPASQLAVFREEDSIDTPALSEMENIFSALRNSSVDIVTSSVDTTDTTRGPESTVHSILLERLVRLKKKAVAFAVGNHGPWLDSVRGFRSAESAFSIGGFVPPETSLANLGVIPSVDSVGAEYSGWGPSGDGGLKPDFLALTETLSEYTSLPMASAYEKPLGLYGVSGGTSAAAPNAAGHLALLLSAAKQKKIKYDPLRLRAAIASTAKFLPGIAAQAQGYGLIQVASAWHALQTANTWEPPTIISSASVVSREQSKRESGRGIFEMSGWRPGMSGVRYITLTRTSGGSGYKMYQLRWKDNSGAFSSPLKEIVLPLGKSVRLPVEVRVRETGSYSAILELVDPNVDLVAHSVLITILVAQPLATSAGDNIVLRQTLPRPGSSVTLIEVPRGLSMLKVRVTRADGVSDVSPTGIDNWFLTAKDPTGRRLPFSLYGAALVDEQKGASVNGERVQVFQNPVPGVWQFSIQVRRAWLQPSAKVLQSTELKWEFNGYRVTAMAENREATASFVNAGSSVVKARVIAVGLGGQRDAVFTLKRGLRATLFYVTVPQGAKRLQISLSQERPLGHVGLYIYKVPEKADEPLGDPTSVEPTALVYYDPSFLERKDWTLDSPKPGKYVIAIDPLEVPSEGLRVHYRDLIIDPSYGELRCDDKESVMTPGTEKAANLSWNIASWPTQDRKLTAETALISSDIGYSTSARESRIDGIEIVSVPLATQAAVINREKP